MSQSAHPETGEDIMSMFEGIEEAIAGANPGQLAPAPVSTVTKAAPPAVKLHLPTKPILTTAASTAPVVSVEKTAEPLARFPRSVQKVFPDRAPVAPPGGGTLVRGTTGQILASFRWSDAR